MSPVIFLFLPLVSFSFFFGCIKRPKSQRGRGVRARAFTHWSSRGRRQADTRSGPLRSRLGERSISDMTPSPKTKGRHTHSPVYTHPKPYFFFDDLKREREIIQMLKWRDLGFRRYSAPIRRRLVFSLRSLVSGYAAVVGEERKTTTAAAAASVDQG